MGYQTIISADDLSSHRESQNWFVFDCRFSLGDPEAGRKRFLSGHIPGAQFADMDKDLASPVTDISGRHPLPDPIVFSEKLSDWGVGNDSQVICYDDLSGAFAARMWWLLKWLGHEDVAVLDGGIGKWMDRGLPLEEGESKKPRANFSGTPDNTMWVDVNYVSDRVKSREICLLDARTRERFTGEDRDTDPVPGHVPGADSYPFSGNLSRSGTFHSAQKLKSRFESLFVSNDAERIVAMCGSGVTACHNLLAIKIAGFEMPLLYVGSWSEWIRDAERPVRSTP